MISKPTTRQAAKLFTWKAYLAERHAPTRWKMLADFEYKIYGRHSVDHMDGLMQQLAYHLKGEDSAETTKTLKATGEHTQSRTGEVASLNRVGNSGPVSAPSNPEMHNPEGRRGAGPLPPSGDTGCPSKPMDAGRGVRFPASGLSNLVDAVCGKCYQTIKIQPPLAVRVLLERDEVVEEIAKWHYENDSDYLWKGLTGEKEWLKNRHMDGVRALLRRIAEKKEG